MAPERVLVYPISRYLYVGKLHNRPGRCLSAVEARLTGFRCKGTPNRQLHRQDGIRITMAHAVTPAIEGAYVI